MELDPLYCDVIVSGGRSSPGRRRSAFLVASAWLFKYILVEDRKAYESKGWEVVGPGPCLGGWDSLIVKRRA